MPVFLVVVFLCVLILVFSLSGKLKFLTFLEKPTSAIQGFSYKLIQKLPFVSESAKVKRLEDENLNLLSKIADFEKLKRENAALSDQFQTSNPQNSQLLKAEIIGAQSFVPGVSTPNNFIINKGLKDDLKVGMVVIIKNNLIGIISEASNNLSEVKLISNPSLSFTAKTETGAVGIVKGGESLTINSILLSENIKQGELVLTKGDIGSSGIGIPPDLVVGKIISVEKNPSDLFQKAKIESLINFINLSIVFVYLQ